MTKKTPDATSITNELKDASLFFAPASIPSADKSAEESPETVALGSTSKPTQNSTQPREIPRDISSDNPRGKSRELPTREEVQEFSFRLRDELKVKVQAEVPYKWQDEFEELARKLDVKKLELYRYIFGEFLGKVNRKNDA